MKQALKLFTTITLAAAGAVAVFLAFMIIFWPGEPKLQAQPTLLGPNVYAYTAVTAAQSVIGSNPTRHALQICNPGGSNILWCAPQGNTINTGVAVTPAANCAGCIGVPVTSAGTVPCFAPPLNAPSIGQGWSCFSTTTPATVYEWP